MIATSQRVEGEIVDDDLPPMVQLTREETIASFERQVRQYRGVSAEEFLRQLDAGELDDIADDPINHPGITYLIMLGQLVR